MLSAVLVCVIALAGCHFSGEDDSEEGEHNSCQVDDDCATRICQQGRCVSSSQGELKVSLLVTPRHMQDGSQRQSLVSETFVLESGDHNFELTLPTSVPVRIFTGDRELAAQVSFTPHARDNPLSSQTTQLNTVVPNDAAAQASVSTNKVVLLRDTEYDVVVQPVDQSLPTRTLRFKTAEDASLEVDYREVVWQPRTFVVHNAPSGAYYLQARAEDGGQLITNSVLIENDTGLVTLLFDPDLGDKDYDLQFTPVKPSPTEVTCGMDAVPTPTLSVASSELERDDSRKDVWVVEFPNVPAAVQYSGTITRCDDLTTGDPLSVAFKANSLSFHSPSTAATIDAAQANAAAANQASAAAGAGAGGASGVDQAKAAPADQAEVAEAGHTEASSSNTRGSYDATTTATWNADLKAYSFCTKLLPGEYTVVITPPANMTCATFAERRTVYDSGEGRTDKAVLPQAASEPDLLSLRLPTTLSGRIETPDMAPIANASLDLVALYASSVVVADDDRAVPAYNRTRQATTPSDGSFSLAADLGSYDLIVRAPAQSNYAWRVLYSVEVAVSNTSFATVLSLTPPVVMNGQLHYAGGDDSAQSSLAGAEVHAYTLVDEDEPTEHSVEIARGTADSTGKVTLLFPPSLQKGW